MSSLLEAGIELMLIGMGTVFVFLTLLVFATSLMSRLVLRFAPVGTTRATAAGPTPEEVAAITLALTQHRQRPPSN